MANLIISQRDTQLEKQRTGFIELSLTNFTTSDEPAIAAGSVVEISGSLYSFTTNESITGWSGVGVGDAYIKLVPDGTDPCTAEFTVTAPTWSDAKQGWYDSTGADRYVAGLYKTSATGYHRKFIYSIRNSQIETNRISIFPSSNISLSFASPNINPTGLTYDSSTGNLISCDINTDLIYIHDGVSSTILSSFASPSTTPRGLTYDSSTGNLISCDNNTDLIYIHDGVSSTILSSFASPSTDPRGLAYDSSTGNLISCDIVTELIYIHLKNLVYI